MVFRRAGKNIWEMKVVHDDGRSAILSCGTDDRETAEAVEDYVRTFRRKRRWDVVDLLITKRVNAPRLFDEHDQKGTAAAEAMISAAVNAPTVVDLRQYLEPWKADRESKRKRGWKVVKDYLGLIRRLYSQDEKDLPITTATFTKDELSSRIEALPIQNPSKTRHKAAVTQFAKYLLERKILTNDPTIGLPTWGANAARESYKESLDAQKFVLSRPEPYRSIEAFLYAFAAEWCAAENLLVSDLTLDTDPPQAYVRGQKNRHRARWVPLVDELDWVLPILKAAVKGKMPEAKVFAVPRSRAYRRHQQAEKDQHLPVTTLHDWRHTHAVALLRWGYDEQIVAAHLGHGTTEEVRETYGRWIPKRADYARKKPRGQVSLEVTSKTRRVK